MSQGVDKNSNENKQRVRDRSESEVTSSTLYEDESGRYGFGKCEPNAVQCCNNPKGFLVTYCFFVIVQGMLVNGFINVSISTLEKRFGLKSSETGVVSTGYDIAFCCLTMFVTYFGARAHRPRWVAIGAFMMGVGAMVFWLPHFTTPPYEYSDGFSDICLEESKEDCESTSTYLKNYLYVFIFAQLLHGAGCTPLYTLGLSFIEDSVAKESAALYLGIANAASIFGPVLGYGFGGIFLEIWVDFDTGSQPTIDPSDPRWVGAWWLGMMISMVCAWVVTIPFFGYPKEFPGTAKLRAARTSEVPENGGEDIANRENFGKSFKDFPLALWTLMKNPAYMLGNLASCSEAMVISGFTTFLPKIIENQFQQSAGFAAIVAGVISIPGGIVGHVLAGLLIKKFKMRTSHIYIFNVVCCLLVCAGAPSLFLACSNQPVAGITFPYPNESAPSGVLSSVCNTNCSCQEEFFIPVCGIDNLNYFTACHAGCINSSEINGTTYYYNCSCIPGNTSEGIWMAKEGSCESDCGSLPAFLGVFFVVVLFTFLSNTPALVATFRVVPENMRSFALGVQWLLIRALGSIPGPILFGTIIDLTCVLWQTRECDDSQGSCWIYDSNSMSINVMAISIACKLVSAMFFALAWWFYKPPPNSTFDDNELKDQAAFSNETFEADDSESVEKPSVSDSESAHSNEPVTVL